MNMSMSVDQERNFLLASVGGVLVLSSVIASGLRLGLRQRQSSVVANLVARIKAWWMIAAASVGLKRGLTGAKTAPSLASAMNSTTRSRLFSPQQTTRSCSPMPR